MPYDLTIQKKDDVLWISATGTRSFETVLSMSKDVLAACAQEKVKKVLLDVRNLEGRLNTMDAYDIANTHFPQIRDRNVITHIAIVDLKEFENRYMFFENVAVNRGFMLRIFPGVDEAVAWLQK